jgi:uncharacterized protein YjiS (DUF1127 family)
MPAMTQHPDHGLGRLNWRDALARGRAVLTKWLMRKRTRRHLSNLDSNLLSDVGLDKRDRARECAKWFWQGVPTASDADIQTKEKARRFQARVLFGETEKPDQTLRRNRTTTSTRAIS